MNATRLFFLLFALIAFGFTACGPSEPTVHDNRTVFFGGRYIINVQTLGPAANVSTDFKSHISGDMVVTEHVQIDWNAKDQPVNKLLIENGKLTVNGKDYGELKPKSEIRVDPQGQVTITPPPMP